MCSFKIFKNLKLKGALVLTCHRHFLAKETEKSSGLVIPAHQNSAEAATQWRKKKRRTMRREREEAAVGPRTLSLSLQGLSRSLVLWSPPQISRARPDLFPPATPRGKGKGMAPVIVLGLVFV
jgi:hypothetical protein